ncbi:MAG TPA: MFS transporter [Syntrophales bacterium]|nr:MFS transporter [Syntrophales bacterium]HOM06599.1 MFS transporter [Syntrophales bacterium]HON99618.1 MFS transporter [Syntrophales bacterium]HPC00711.1 MFS transporter [Syntrophales bacterium]HPQ06139.1 MFS transporter [Syntrophales bacterium]
MTGRPASSFRVYLNGRMLLMSVLGFSSGLPLALTGSTLSAWLVAEGVDIRTIGLFSLVGIPYALKFLWSPVMDRYVPPFLGRRRGWMMTAQVSLLIAIALTGFLHPSQQPGLVALAALTVAFLSASQDIVLDAYRTEYLRPPERGAGAGVWIMGYRIAILVSGAAALILSDYLPWSAVYVLMGLLMTAGCIATLAGPEPDGEGVPGVPRTLREAVVQPFATFLNRRGAREILAFIILYKIGDVAAAQMTTPYILQHIGFSRTELGTIFKGFGMVATVAGTVFGGGLMSRWSLKRALFVFGVLQGISTISFLLLELTGRQVWALSLVIAVENFTGGMGTAAYIAFLMALCDRRFTATQYALLSSLMAVSRYVTGAPTGYLVHTAGWITFFVTCTAAAVPALILLRRYDRWEGISEGPLG